MQIQQKIAKEHAVSLVGKALDVLIQGTDEHGNLIARTEYDSLDIDCLVLLPSAHAPPGEIIKAKIIDTHGYDLIGEPI
jgi:ribosomal protein S12 methylthiotransferase